MSVKLPQGELKEIRDKVKNEFPNDPALQEVHFARKVLAREAENSGQSFLEYVKTEAKKVQRRKKKIAL